VARQSSGGGGGGGGNGPIVGSWGGGGVITGLLGVSNPAPIVVAPVTGGVLGASTFIFNMNLRLGMSNNDVRELQIRLTDEGVYTGPITGYFGSLTLKAVKAYQAKKGLPQTGFVGPMTRAVLNGTEPANPLSEREATIESIRQQIQNLMTQLAELQAQLGIQ
jgi:peptidoglycan hydrolase-like protein with peptidoglycan-binding domain